MQYEENGGLCGVSADAWNAPVREHEAGGKYATGIITRHYRTNQTIPVTAQITANHLGYIEFRLCPNNDVTTAVTHACLDQYLLGRHHSRLQYNAYNTRITQRCFEWLRRLVDSDELGCLRHHLLRGGVGCLRKFAQSRSHGVSCECCVSAATEDGETRFPVPDAFTGNMNLQLQLPVGLTCTQCVIQWKYNAGASH